MGVKTTFRSWTLSSIVGNALQVGSTISLHHAQCRALSKMLGLPASSALSSMQCDVMHTM